MVIFIMLLAGFVPLLQVTFSALLEDFYPGRLTVKDRDKTPRIIGLILIMKDLGVADAILNIKLLRDDNGGITNKGWPDLLSKKGGSDDDGVDKMVLPMISPRLIPDANATNCNPMDIHDFTHLGNVAADHETVELQFANSQWNNRSHLTCSL
jgi:hypothetical protein